MPVTRSAKKKLRQDRNRQKLNLLVRKQVKDVIKKFKKSPNEKLLMQVFKHIDIAAKKNIFHPNKSARLKSRLSKLLEKKKSNSRKKTRKSTF